MLKIDSQKMHYIALILILLGGISMVSAKQLYDFEVKAIDGKQVKLDAYKGKVIMIVNTASKCGFTKQYDDLQNLYDKYGKDGLIILGFPANNFLAQEPGSNDEIQEFCRINYGVNFPMFAKISVKGKNMHPLYKYLTEKDSNPKHSGKISWNFTKFLISREGEIINRFAPATSPADAKVISAIEKALQE